MGVKFNPFTSKLDVVDSPDGDFDSIDVSGDITLDDGGTYTTTIQAVTATQDRTISFPDATGTVALVNGANGTIQYNDAGTLNGNSDFTVDPDWNDAAVTFTGLKLNVTNTASAAGSNLLDLQVGGASQLSVKTNGNLRIGSTTAGAIIGAGDNSFRSIQFGGSLLGSNGIGAITSGSAFNTRSNGSFGWVDGTNPYSGTVDLSLVRGASGVVKVTDGSTGTGYIKQVPVLTANLPNAATVGAGTRGFVSDAGTLTFNSPIGAGTGTPSDSTTIPVFSDGSVWKAG
jgi:hypothetical protein